MKNKEGNFYKSVSILVGTVVGAGVFGLPYVVAKIGFIPGMVYLIILAAAVLIVTLGYGEVVLRTKGNYQMSGYVGRYLGNKGKFFITLSLILGIYGGLLAYTIGVGNFLFAILHPFLGGTPLIYSLIFWLVASSAVFYGLDIIAPLELFMVGLLVFVIFFIFGISLPEIRLSNLTYISFHYLFLPFGVMLFALGGASAIPAMKEVLEKGKQLSSLKKAIILGMVIPVIIYLVFSFAVVGVNGPATSEQVVSGLSPVLGRKIVYLAGILGILTMATSFLALSYVLKGVYQRDYHLSPFIASFLTCSLPLIIFLLGLRSFVQVLGISGAILSGFQGILLLMTYQRAKQLGNRRPEYELKLPHFFLYLLYFIFSLGIIYQIIYLLI